MSVVFPGIAIMGCAPGSHLSRRESSARPNLVNLPGRSTR